MVDDYHSADKSVIMSRVKLNWKCWAKLNQNRLVKLEMVIQMHALCVKPNGITESNWIVNYELSQIRYDESNWIIKVDLNLKWWVKMDVVVVDSNQKNDSNQIGKLSQIELEMLSQIESEYLSQIGNCESNVCCVYQIKLDNWVKLNWKFRVESNRIWWVKLNQKIWVEAETVSKIYVVAVGSNQKTESNWIGNYDPNWNGNPGFNWIRIS